MAYSKWYAKALSGSSGQVVLAAPNTGGGEFAGFTVRNTSAVAVQVDFYDNTAGSGTLLASVDLTAKGSVGASATIMADEGVRYFKGVWAVFSGTGVQGSIFLA